MIMKNIKCVTYEYRQKYVTAVDKGKRNICASQENTMMFRIHYIFSRVLL